MRIPHQVYLPRLPLLLAVLTLVGCSGSSSDNTSSALAQGETNTSAEVGVAAVSTATAERDEQEVASGQNRTLINEFDTRCIVVDEPFSLTVNERVTPADGSAAEVSNVSAYVDLFQSDSSSVELLSRTDEMLNLVMRKQDIASVTTTLESVSVTAYIGAFNVDAPATAVLRKPVPGGCFYALRLDTDRFCGATVAKSSNVSISLGDEGISMTGCELNNPLGYTVIEIPAESQ